MANEAWLNGKLPEFSPLVMPAAHALVQAIADLEKFVRHLSVEELFKRPNNSSSIAFHLRHIAGSIDRLLTYSRGEELSALQFEMLKAENNYNLDLNTDELVQKAIDKIYIALDALKNVAPESLFETRFVGREKLSTNVFGLLFHIAEHTARHVGQVVTLAGIVQKSGNKLNL